MKGTLKRTTAAILAALLLATAGTATVAMAETSAALTASEAEESVDTITLPNGEVREIETIEPAVTALPTSLHSAESTASVTEDESSIVEIGSIEDFENVSSTDWYANKTFVITNDLDVSSLFTGKSDWSGAIQYFLGTLKGKDIVVNGESRAPIISGIPNNCALIYGIIGGNIENLTFKYDGQASFITLMPINYGSNNVPLVLKDVTTEGYVSLDSADQSNYSPFVFTASPGGLEMNHCINNASITGPVYASVFHGYYMLYGTKEYKFINCINNGELNLEYAGMFFGNSSNIDTRLKDNPTMLTIQNCKNTAVIRGTKGSRYLAAPVTTGDGAFQNTNPTAVVESVLNENESTMDGATSTYTNVQPVTNTGDGALCEQEKQTGFDATLSGDTITITRPTGETVIDYYVVSVSAYVNTWIVDENVFSGTDRHSVTETISTSDFGDAAQKTATLKAYGFCDDQFGFPSFEEVLDYNILEDDDGNCYYAVDNTKEYAGQDPNYKYNRYVSNAVDAATGLPVGEGAVAADFVTVSAYDSNHQLVEFKSLKSILPGAITNG